MEFDKPNANSNAFLSKELVNAMKSRMNQSGKYLKSVILPHESEPVPLQEAADFDPGLTGSKNFVDPNDLIEGYWYQVKTQSTYYKAIYRGIYSDLSVSGGYYSFQINGTGGQIKIPKTFPFLRSCIRYTS
jgi:hypothetical protein